MHDFQEQCQTIFRRAMVCCYFLQNNGWLVSFFYIRNNQVLGKCYQPQPLARLVTPRPLIIPDIAKSHSVGVQYRHWLTWPCLEIWLKFAVLHASRLTRCVLKLDLAHAWRGKSINVYNRTIHYLCVFGMREDWRVERIEARGDK